MFSRVGRSIAPRIATGAQHRALNLHEYSSKKLLGEFGVSTEMGIMCETLQQVEVALGKIKSHKKVVKSQILAGGRGKGTFEDGFEGGVHVCNDSASAMEVAKKMLGNKLITKQTNGKGITVSKLYITEAIPNIKRELYLALVLDRQTCCPTFIGSAEGGVGIEELAATNPEKIKKLPINIHDGINENDCVQFALELGFDDAGAEQASKQIVALYNLAKAKDCTMVEINPLVELDDKSVMCIDAKLGFDDNARFRRPEIWAQADLSEKDPKEILANSVGLNYIALDGNVGCLVNGAGLAMATMDIISLYGQEPANFLDVGGSARTEQIITAFEIISQDKNVKCILVNIFGGIMKCDVISAGIVAAVNTLGDKMGGMPIVVRLEGTNEKEGKEMLKQSGLKIHICDNLDEGARVATELTKAALA